MANNNFIDTETVARLQEYVDTLRIQADQLRSERSLRRDIYNNTRNLYDLTKDILFIDEESLGTRETTKKLLQKQISYERTLKDLYHTQLVLQTKHGAVYTRLAEDVEDTLEVSQKFKNTLEDQLKLSKEIQNTFAVQLGTTLEELTSKYLGKTFSEPFKDAVDASRDAVRQRKLMNREASREADIIEDIKNHTLTRKEADAVSLKHYRVYSKRTGAELRGRARTNALRNNAANVNIRRVTSNRAIANPLTAGLKGFMKGISGMTVAFTGAAAVLKFIVDLFIQAQKQNVDIARTLSVSREEAGLIRESFSTFAADSGKMYVTIERMVEAQKAYVDEIGLAIKANEQTLGQQNFLVHRLGLAENEAAKIGLRFDAIGKNAEVSVDAILKMSDELRRTQGLNVNRAKLFREIAEASGQTVAFYRGSNVELAKAVMLTNKRSLSLKQAKQISEGLLDFESSLKAELSAELVTGKQFNMELARQYALTGQIAKATEEVMKQVGSYEEFANLNVIAQNSLAQAVGLTSDELADSLLKQKMINREMKNFLEGKRDLWTAENNALAQQLALQGLSQDEIEKTITAGESFREAMDKVKSEFTSLVDEGILYDLTDALRSFVDWLLKMGFGSSSRQARAREISKSDEITGAIASGAVTRAEINELLRQSGQEAGWLERLAGSMSLTKYTTGINPADLTNMQAAAATEKLAQIQSNYRNTRSNQTQTVEDFVLKTHPKDTIVAAGGTKLADTDKMTKYLAQAVTELQTLREEVVKVNKKPNTFYEL